jgi:hypothetical protein
LRESVKLGGTEPYTGRTGAWLCSVHNKAVDFDDIGDSISCLSDHVPAEEVLAGSLGNRNHLITLVWDYAIPNATLARAFLGPVRHGKNHQ